MKFLKFSFSLLLLFSCSSIDFKESGHVESVEKLYPGFYYGVVNGKEQIVNNSYGFASPEFRHVSENTSFHIFSITKIFTALSVMQLQDRGLLCVEDSIQDYISWVPYNVTIAQIMSHSSGIPNPVWGNFFTHYSETHDEINPGEILKDVVLKNPELEFKPGTDVMYSNLGFAVLGELVQEISGMEYTEYVKSNIFSLLDMDHSGFHPDEIEELSSSYISTNPRSEQVMSQVLEGNTYTPQGNWIHIRDDYIFDLPAHGGAIVSGSDLAKFLNAVINRDSGLLSKDGWELWFTPYSSNGKESYALGWRFTEINGEPVYGHGGGAMGVSTLIYYYPERAMASIALSNLLDSSRLFNKDMNKLDAYFLKN